MFKGRTKWILIGFLWLFGANLLAGDTTQVSGFSHYADSYDSIFLYFKFKKKPSITPFILNDSLFKTEFASSNDKANPLFSDVYYKTYAYQIEKSFAKVFKKLHKKPFNYKRLELDETLRYPMSKNGDKIRVELLVSHKKNKAIITYYLWKVNGRWYLLEKFKFRKA
jgi:hypothetical protein